MVLVAVMYSCLSIGTRFMNVGMTANIAFATRSLAGFILGYLLFALIFKTVSARPYFASTTREWVLYLFLGVFGYAGSVLLISYGVLLTNLFTVAVLFATVPLFVSLFDFIIFGKRISSTYIGFLILSIVGVALCSLTTNNTIDLSLGALLVLGSAALSATYIIGVSHYTGALNSRELGLLLMLIASVTGFVYSFFTGFAIHYADLWSITFVVGLCIGALFNIATSVLEPWAFQNVHNVTIGSQILLLEVVFSLIFGFVLFSEVPTLMSIIGSILIVGSVAANNALGAKA